MGYTRQRIGLGFLWILAIAAGGGSGPALAEEMDWIRVSDDHRGFVGDRSGRAFRPWGFNHDRDDQGRLIEDYWEAEWPTVESDFREMKDLGANVVRVHLQFGKFMTDRDRPNPAALDRLGKLLDLAERLGLYLDLTGLGSYHRKDVPEWYNRLSEPDRWQAQARFWEAVAGRCVSSPVVFCYDLMNEPVVPGGRVESGDWTPGPPLGGKHYVQFITIDGRERPRPMVAREWIATLTKAIRKQDRRHLVTVGLVDWSLDRPGLTSGFVPTAIVNELDFVCVHLYPKTAKVDEAIETLKGFAVGKPVVIEETFPLSCGQDDFERFITRSREVAAGVIGFYWGKTIEEMRRSNTISDALTRNWLEYFQKESGTAKSPEEKRNEGNP